ncbi:alpha/beta fold hydrolase [Maritimibacter sp. DP1N21-5]|uniref:alpha/beta fold hydrolase n=1 Tax=Maritimibacter sp. DP1N21-5 TaxID=2836867 RepID=UPI001C442DD3|nr:alpha/beta hydrolase [Maritimibacter sp. DP1N21-5]MBV7408300.1 alpha/beta hydrolase [Maritimibacter sp. DP1N21-5]
MIWFFLCFLAFALAVAPFVRELFRHPPQVDRADAQGETALLEDGVTHYHWHGPTTDSVIVLIHGLSSPSWVFAGLIRGLNMMGYQVLSYDLYGRGLSDRPRDRQTPEFFLSQLTRLLDEQGLEGPVSIMGYSMGGVIGALFAARYPERVDRLILLAPAGMDYVPGPLLGRAGNSGLFGHWLWQVAGPKTLREAARRDAAGPTVIPDLADRIDAELSRRGYLRAVLSAHKNTLSLQIETVHRDIGRMGTPVLAIWGEEDAVIPLTAIGKLTQWNRNARHHVVKGAGHALPHTAPTAIIAAVTEFLREV